MHSELAEEELPEFEHEEVAALIEDAELEQQDEELSFALIAKRNLPEDFLAETDAEGIARAVAGLTHVHLDRCRLARLGGGDGPRGVNDPFLVANAMRNVTSLYLQYNRLTSTVGISSVRRRKHARARVRVHARVPRQHRV